MRYATAKANFSIFSQADQKFRKTGTPVAMHDYLITEFLNHFRILTDVIFNREIVLLQLKNNTKFHKTVQAQELT